MNSETEGLESIRLSLTELLHQPTAVDVSDNPAREQLRSEHHLPPSDSDVTQSQPPDLTTSISANNTGASTAGSQVTPAEQSITLPLQSNEIDSSSTFTRSSHSTTSNSTGTRSVESAMQPFRHSSRTVLERMQSDDEDDDRVTSVSTYSRQDEPIHDDDPANEMRSIGGSSNGLQHETANSLQNAHHNVASPMEVSTPSSSSHNTAQSQTSLSSSLSQMLSDFEEDDDVTDRRNGNVHYNEELTLRGYQLELARAANDGLNVIVCAPTGSGKTVIAVHIVKEHFARTKSTDTRRVAFLVTTQNLVDQQRKLFDSFTTLKCTGISGGDRNQTGLKWQLEERHVFVMTPNILLNALNESEEADRVELQRDFSMIVFDECHHCTTDHPYNVLMQKYYFEAKQNGKKLPQVVGLTASPGTDKANKTADAIKHILSLCANLDIRRFCTVRNQENIEELNRFVSLPASRTLVCDVRNPEQDKCGTDLSKFMGILSNRIKEVLNMNEETILLDLGGNREHFSKFFPPQANQRGSATFNSYLGYADINVQRVKDLAIRRPLVRYIDVLKVINNALMLHQMARTADAHNFMKRKFSSDHYLFLSKGDSLNDEWSKKEERLLSYCKQLDSIVARYADSEESLLAKIHPIWPPFCQEDPLASARRGVIECPMQKLLCLRYEICRLFDWDVQKKTVVDSEAINKQDSRVLVFVSERKFGQALLAYFKRDIYLKQLNPDFLSGANAPSESGGLTQYLQTELLKMFREGRHKVVIATSVAEEGVDIKECNLVVRYCYATNEIAKLQSRGRARADKSSEILIVDRTMDWLTKKEETNNIRIQIMEQAIKSIVEKMEKNETDYLDRIKELQEEAYYSFKMKQHSSNSRANQSVSRAQPQAQMRSSSGQYEVLCKKCAALLCENQTLKIMGQSSYVILDTEIYSRVYLAPLHQTSSSLSAPKLNCVKCQSTVANMLHQHNMNYAAPLIKEISFRCTSNGETSAKKKWSEAPFEPSKADLKELMKYNDSVRERDLAFSNFHEVASRSS